MDILQIMILALVQGIAELLPVSSSAHVIMAEKLMGLDPTRPEMTLLLVMLHTGTMFAAIAYFWKSWRETYFSSGSALRRNGWQVLLATLATGVVGLVLLKVIKHVVAGNNPDFEIESIFGNHILISSGLAVAGVLIIIAGLKGARSRDPVTSRTALLTGAVQGLCLPFRGLSRSGSTISTGMLAGVAHKKAEEFSFALAVVLTPAVIAKEVLRLIKAHSLSVDAAGGWLHLFAPSLIGMVFSFLAGLIALRWLSRWLETGRWHLFGFYCLAASVAVYFIG